MRLRRMVEAVEGSGVDARFSIQRRIQTPSVGSQNGEICALPRSD